MAPGQFQLLPHPSDVGVRARGGSREEALVAASRGLTSVMVNPDTVELQVEQPLRGTGADEAAQKIVAWLNDILYRFDADRLVLRDFSIMAWASDGIVGVGRGEKFDPARHSLRTAVKAVTYHQFDLRRTDRGWQLQVFLDL